VAAVDPGFAEWLKARALFATSADAGVAAAFGADAIESEILTPFALKADADAEAARQLAFLSGPLAIDQHVVAGLRSDLFGKAVTIVTSKLGYDAGKPVFVIGAEEAEDREETTLTVVRKL
jgi:hypothetical protein